MNDPRKILVLVPDGIGIKNYLYSKVFKSDSTSVSILHSFNVDTLDLIKEHISIEESISLPYFKEGIREKYLRELIHFSRLHFNAETAKNPTILDFWNPNKRSAKGKAFYSLIELRGRSIKNYDHLLKIEKMYDKAIRKNPFYSEVKKILKDHRPDTLFCTHQRALTAPAVFAAAKDLGIDTVTVIYSWDNIPKARLALRSNLYCVWSEHMKKELQLFYPEILDDAIAVTGTPQFEFYFDNENVIAKDEFYSRYNLDPNKRLICFSGDDEFTSPYDPHYLNDVAEELTAANMNTDYQIVFRRSPADLSRRYDWVLEKFPDLIVEIPPLWRIRSESWTTTYPTFDDVRLLVSLAKYADLVINLGSTMAFDFGMFNKPCIYINYDHDPKAARSVKTIYNYQHFRSMPHQNSVYWFRSKEEIPTVIKEAINANGDAAQEWFRIVAQYPDSASERIQKLLE